MKHVVMFHIGRSGSTVLGDMLDQQGQLRWAHELYLPIFLNWAEQQGRNEDSHAIDPVAFFESRLAEAAPKPFGFEVKFFHLAQLSITLPEFLSQIIARGVTQFIVLRRRNTLRKVVSSVVAHSTATYHVPFGASPCLHPVRLDLDQIEIDLTTASLLQLLEQYEADFRQLERLLTDWEPLKLTYEEDVLPDPHRAYQRICHYLGLAERPVVVQYGRTNPFPLRKMVTNYDELACLLAPTPYAWMLDE